MRRLVHTTEGWMDLNATRGFSTLTVVVTAFDVETGWESASKFWDQRHSEESLASVIAEARGVPADEAQRIADETLQQWRARGGETAERASRKFIGFIASAVGLAIIGALALVAAVVLLIVGWL
jgi:hypothetical protein